MTENFNQQVLNLFPTAVLAGRLPSADILNPQLRQVIAENRQASPGNHRSNVLGWQSTTDMLSWGGAPAHELGRLACAFIDPYSHDLASPKQPRFGWMAELWANVSPKNASNQMHNHPGALWSLVYYVDDGYDPGAGNQGGELVLYDPRSPMNRMYAPDMVFKWPGGQVERAFHPIRPQSGMMVAFPSWMNHSVRPYLGNRERISIAINLMIAVPPKQAG